MNSRNLAILAIIISTFAFGLSIGKRFSVHSTGVHVEKQQKQCDLPKEDVCRKLYPCKKLKAKMAQVVETPIEIPKYFPMKEKSDKITREKVKKVFNRHQFTGFIGYSPDGVKIKQMGNVVLLQQDFRPVFGGGYKYMLNEHLGLGAMGFSNLTFGATVSWEF